MSHDKKKSFAIVFGTAIQQRIANAILPELNEKYRLVLVSLENYYQLRIDSQNLRNVLAIKCLFSKPWYDRSPFLKLISLPYFFFQLVLLSRNIRYFLFFVDTGILERTAIYLLKRLGCYTIVLQDAMKLPSTRGNNRSLMWFGSGKADLYLLIGKRYIPMIQQGQIEVVGSPIYSGKFTPLPLGEKILVIDQCTARYGWVNHDLEFSFMSKIVQEASDFGPVELRLHPHNNPSRYEILNSSNVEVTFQKPLSRSLEEAGVVLSIYSTIILEALSVGRPVLTLDWRYSPYENLINAGIKRCMDMEEMRKGLRAWKQDPLSLFPNSMEEIQNELQGFVAFHGRDAINNINQAITRFIQNA